MKQQSVSSSATRLTALSLIFLQYSWTASAAEVAVDGVTIADDWQMYKPLPREQLMEDPFCMNNCTVGCFARCPVGKFILPKAQEYCAQDCFGTCTNHCERNTTLACFDICLAPCIDSDCKLLNSPETKNKLLTCATRSCSSDCHKADKRCMVHMLYQIKKKSPLLRNGCDEGTRLGEDGVCVSLEQKELTLDEELYAEGWTTEDIASVESALSFGLPHKVIMETMQMTIVDKTDAQIEDLLNKLTGHEQKTAEERLLVKEYRGCTKVCQRSCHPPTGDLPEGPGWRNMTINECKWDCFNHCSMILSAQKLLCHERCMGMKEHPNSFSLKEWCDGWCWPVNEAVPGNEEDFVLENKGKL